MRVENQPYGRLNEIIYDQAFTVHPYKHPTIGSMKDLEAASIDDVREFFRTYYVPNNATLVLVGDFDTKEATQLVQQYLGRVPKATRPVPRDIPKEPPQTKERRVRLDENWPLPAVVVAHHITFDGHPDSYPLHIASKMLSDGQSSRIYRKLVYEKQLALAAFGGGNIIEDPNLFFAVAIVQPGQTPRRGGQRADRRARSAAQRADLGRASCSRRRTSSRATTSSAASPTRTRRRTLGARGRHPQRHQDRRRRVRHLHEHHGRRRPARRADLLQAGESPGADHHAARLRAPGVADDGSCARQRRCRSVCWRRAPYVGRRSPDWPSERPPRPLPARDVKFPPYALKTLANGLQVIAVSHHEQPAVSLRLMVRAGGAQDPADKPGRGGARRGPARSGHHDAARPSRLPHASIRSAASSAPAPAPTSPSSRRS